jgi:hypothetical protein
MEFVWREALPLYDSIPSPVCLTCGRRECGLGFVDTYGESVVWDKANGDNLLNIDRCFYAVCVERMVTSCFGGLSRTETEELERDVQEAETKAAKATAEADVWRFRIEAFKSLFKTDAIGSPA